MDLADATVGTRVRTLVAFSGVPQGTEGVIDEDYETGVTVAWDFHERPLPRGYRAYDGRPAIASGILRDGFDKATELAFLEQVSGGVPADDPVPEITGWIAEKKHRGAP